MRSNVEDSTLAHVCCQVDVDASILLELYINKVVRRITHGGGEGIDISGTPMPNISWFLKLMVYNVISKL